MKGANPRTVVVGSDGTASVAFDVVCAQVSDGDLDVRPHHRRPAGPRRLPARAWPGADTRAGLASMRMETYDGLTPGIHLITLKDLDRSLRRRRRQPTADHDDARPELSQVHLDGLVRRARR